MAFIHAFIRVIVISTTPVTILYERRLSNTDYNARNTLQLDSTEVKSQLNLKTL